MRISHLFGRTINDGLFRPLGILFETLEINRDEIFSDGFESGDAAALSATVPLRV